MPTHQLIWTEHDALPGDLEIGDEVRYFYGFGAGPGWRKVVEVNKFSDECEVVFDPPEIEYKTRWLMFTKEIEVSPSVIPNDKPLHVRRRHRVPVKGLS